MQWLLCGTGGSGRHSERDVRNERKQINKEATLERVIAPPSVAMGIESTGKRSKVFQTLGGFLLRSYPHQPNKSCSSINQIGIKLKPNESICTLSYYYPSTTKKLKTDIMIETGAKADFDFSIKAIQNGEEKEINFNDLLDKPTIVSVYMKNNTDGCDRQTKDLADHAEWFSDKGYNLVAISKDTCGSHKRYAKKQGIDFTLVSDPEYKFGEATDSIVQKKMFGNEYEAPSRSAFVIDTDGTILGVVEKVNTKDHAGELKELVEHLK